MNSKMKLFALALGGALFATAAFAGEGDTPAAESQVQAKTRAQVRAELKTLPPLSQGDRYPVLEETAVQRTRAEVRAESAKARPEHFGA